MSDNEKEVIYIVESKNKGDDSLKTYNIITYALYAAGFFTGGVSWIVAIIMNYLKRGDAVGTIYESHINWQIRTFWWAFLWAVLGGILSLVGVGLLILLANFVWVIYRVVKGFIKLGDNQPIL